jgi:hypothetical protein
MPPDRIAEIRKELALLREELRQAEAAHVLRVTDRIDVLLNELVHLGHKIVVSPSRGSN